MTYTLFNNTYEVWKTVYMNHSSSWGLYQYVVNDTERKVWTGNSEYIYHCVVSSEEYADYSGSFESSATVVSSSDDAKASIVGLSGLANPKNADGLPLISLDAEQSDKAVRVAQVGRLGDELILASHNFCDKTTWRNSATAVVSESITSNTTDNITFSASNKYIIDYTHGKVLAENQDTAVDCVVSVRVSGALQTQINQGFTDNGGDYTVDYAAGTITFVSGAVTDPVEIDYHYANDSTWVLAPPAGKMWDVEDAEAQFSENVCMNTGISFSVYGYVDVFAPQYLIANGGPYPPGTKIPIATKNYKTFYQLIDDAQGAYPRIPTLSGTRGTRNPIFGFPFRYGTVRSLYSTYGMEMRVSIVDDIEFGGDRATATFFCLQKDEEF